MKVKGKMILGSTVATMEIGIQYYIEPRSIEITEEGDLYLNLNGITTKVEQDLYAIPIKKLSKKFDDYEIDLNLPCPFYPISQKVIEKTKEYSDLIGPFRIEIIKDQDVTDEEVWNRMTLDELIDLLKENQTYCSKTEWPSEAEAQLVKIMRKKQKETWEAADDIDILKKTLEELQAMEDFELSAELKQIIEKKII